LAPKIQLWAQRMQPPAQAGLLLGPDLVLYQPGEHQIDAFCLWGVARLLVEALPVEAAVPHGPQTRDQIGQKCGT
jgi:hypothetical protein